MSPPPRPRVKVRSLSGVFAKVGDGGRKGVYWRCASVDTRRLGVCGVGEIGVEYGARGLLERGGRTAEGLE